MYQTHSIPSSFNTKWVTNELLTITAPREISKNNMFSSLVKICLHVKKTNKQTSQIVFVTYEKWNSRQESVISNEIGIGKQFRVTDEKKCYRGGKKRR